MLRLLSLGQAGMKMRVMSDGHPHPPCGVSQDNIRFPVPDPFHGVGATPTGSGQ